jgi:hypothetical protein
LAVPANGVSADSRCSAHKSAGRSDILQLRDGRGYESGGCGGCDCGCDCCGDDDVKTMGWALLSVGAEGVLLLLYLSKVWIWMK